MLYPILAVANVLCCAGKYAINALASSQDGTLFLNKTGAISDKYYVAITPAGWTFSIWGFIYTFEMLWIIYSLVNICRKGPNGPAYTDPMFICAWLFPINIVGCGLNVSWLISFDRQELVLAFILLIAYSLVYYFMLGLSYRTLDRASARLIEQGRKTEIWLTRGLLFNGLAMQATWVSIATLLNAAMVATYRVDDPLTATDASTMSLSILTVLIVVFAASDLLALDRYSRYTVTPYIVLVVALAGSLSRNYTEGERNSVFTVVLMVLASVLLLVKLAVTVVRHMKGHRFTTVYDSTVGGGKGNLA